MKNYKVSMHRTYVTEIQVVAQTEKEAILKVETDLNRYNLEAEQCNVSDEWYTAEEMKSRSLKRISYLELRQRLSGKVPVKFYYVKADSTLREAIGTRYTNIIPVSDKPQGVRKASRTSTSYYDYASEGWRAVSNSTQIFIEA